jgi:PAS domain S-box-containing protein
VIYTISRDLTITSLNPAFEKVTGWSRSEWIDRRLEEIVHPDDWPLALEMGMRSFSGEKPPIHEVRIRTKPSGFITAEFSIAEQKENDRVVGIIGIGRDVTERKRIEKELQKAKKLESLGVLAGGIAHDFNNILTPILANISIARAFGSFDDGIVETLTDAEKACLRAKGLTRQLLTFSKGGGPAKKSVPISRLLRDEVRFALSGSNVQCNYAVPEDLWWVEMEEGQVGQVIQNIIINADQAMPSGGTVNVEAANVMVGPSEPLPLKEGKYVRISISDQGIGIPEKHLPRIFDPFYSTKDKGSGLGLSISHTIIERHKGTIQVESELGTGTAFHIYLPSSEKGLRVEEKEWTRAPRGGGRILLIDDDEAVRRSAEEILNRLGYDAECVKDGKEGVRLYLKAKESGRPFGAVIMDLTIPGGMGGKEAIKRLKEKDPGARVIVSSGYSDDPVLQGYSEYGFSGVVAKPYGMDDLAEVIHSVLSGC